MGQEIRAVAFLLQQSCTILPSHSSLKEKRAKIGEKVDKLSSIYCTDLDLGSIIKYVHKMTLTGYTPSA